ncbi:MAG: hypothetical protein ABGZ53_09740 [Fuerstiella sp.]
MSEASTDFNPFQAPKLADLEKKVLGEDDEFLVSRREILCRESVQLPMVCIRFGETEHLERRQKTLRTLTGAGAFLLVLGAVAVLILLGALMAGDLPFSNSPFGILSWVAVFLLAVPAAMRGFQRYGCSKVDATWYVGPRYLRRIRWERRFGRVIVLFAATAGGVSIVRTGGSVIPLIGLAGLAVLLGIFFDPNVSLQLVARRRGVFVLKGHSKKFYREVNRIINGF